MEDIYLEGILQIHYRRRRGTTRSEGRILSESEKDALIQQAGNSYIKDAGDYGVIQMGPLILQNI